VTAAAMLRDRCRGSPRLAGHHLASHVWGSWRCPRRCSSQSCVHRVRGSAVVTRRRDGHRRLCDGREREPCHPSDGRASAAAQALGGYIRESSCSVLVLHPIPARARGSPPCVPGRKSHQCNRFTSRASKRADRLVNAPNRWARCSGCSLQDPRPWTAARLATTRPLTLRPGSVAPTTPAAARHFALLLS
jgi:hypothetical protein